MPDSVDKEGFETLTTIATADNFNRWMFGTIRPFIKGRVLEVGSGIGNISGLLLNMGNPITLSDFSSPYQALLREKFGTHPRLSGILEIDLADPLFDERCGALFGGFDTVIALNVIEHIQDDGQAVANCKKLLKPGGRFIILVPAYSLLYNRFDKELGHYRRYTKKAMQRLLSPHLSVMRCRYFNLAGILGWWVSGTILRNKVIPARQMEVFNALVPVFRIIDQVVFHRLGLSVWSVSVKSSNFANFKST